MDKKIEKLKEQLLIKCEAEQNYHVIPFIKNLKPVAYKKSIAYVQKGKPFIYVNWGKFIKDFTISECYGIINHEFLHLIYNHLDYDKKIENIDNNIHNIAADIIINDYLLDNKYNLPKFALTRKSVEKSLKTTLLGKTSLELYYEILALKEKHSLPPVDGDLRINENDQADPQDGILEDELWDVLEGAKDDLNAKLAEIVESNTPTNIFDFLFTKIGKLIKRDITRTYTRPNRRDYDLMPYNRNTTYIPKISIFVDVSGSMELKPFTIFSKLKRMHRILKDYNVDYYSFNSKIKLLNNIDLISMGGGTNIKKVIQYPTDDDLKIIITDCESDYDTDYNRKKTIIISDNLDLDLGDIIVDENFENIIRINNK